MIQIEYKGRVIVSVIRRVMTISYPCGISIRPIPRIIIAKMSRIIKRFIEPFLRELI
jgi:hypothetical protein